MTNKKSTKHALLMSALALLLCVSMLVGSTYAWFTDSVTSTGNIIKSGTLEVTMEWLDGKLNVPAQDSNDWKNAANEAIFEYDLWEPGYVEVRHLKIENEGTLALKYQLSIIANGEVTDLTDAIDVYYVDPAIKIADRTELLDSYKLGTLTEVLANINTSASGNLLAGEAHTVTLALKMRENAGNEYQDKSIGSTFSVILMATQKDYESDSFDENYDEIEIPEYDAKIIDGNTYLYYNNGDVVLAEVPYGNVGATFALPNNVTILGQGDVYDGAIPVFSKSSPIETITLNEGLIEIKSRAITGVKTLTSINFPSTLKAIREQALRQTGMNTLDIPANVEEIDSGAFRDMANLTTVTIEGNVAFGNYAFRSCPKLETIYLLGDDVTFEGSQFATHSDNGDANGITIYVKNSTVAARVYAAQTSAYGYEVKVLGEEDDGGDAVEVTTADSATALQNVINTATEDTVIVLKKDVVGDITAPQTAGVEVTIEGNGNKFDGVLVVDGKSATILSAGLTIRNVNFVADSISADACIRLGDGTNNTRYTCNVTIENCTFDVPGAVGVKSYTGGDKNLIIRNCTATANAHSLVQAKGIDGILVENCKVYSKNGLNFNNSTNVTVSGCTVDVKGYACRFGESSGGSGAAETYLIKNCTLKSACEDGDAVIVLRGTADYSTLTIENTTLEGTIEITNTATGATVVR